MMNHLDQTFGVEIECFMPDGGAMSAATAAVSQRLTPLNQSAHVSSYGHATPTTWKSVTDGSLGQRGIEFVSPVLRGANGGFAQVDAVCHALSDFGCSVGRACGLHVHVGFASEPSLQFWKNIVKLYSVFEKPLDSILPPSRRGSANTYCRSLSSVSPLAVDRAATREALIGVATNHCHRNERRMHKVNLVAWDRHHTVEFRHHSGTLDPLKARMWILTCLRMCAKAHEADLGGLSASAVAVNQARPGSKAHQIGEMLLRPDGVTGREIMTAMNWPSVSIPQQARMCGIEFTTQRTGREVRYFARTAGQVASPPPVATTIQGFAGFIGSAEDETAYLVRRSQDLAGTVQWAA